MPVEQFHAVVVGGGQAGLAAAHHLARQNCRFVVLEAAGRIGESWRSRWESLKLFTPARFSHLPGLECPAAHGDYQTKDELADYLESYAAYFALPVRLDSRVERVGRRGGHYLLTVGDRQILASHVVVATGAFHVPYIPDFAARIDSGVVQMHAAGYRNPGQLRDGAVLVVGAGNSGAEIALELAAEHKTTLAGRDTGYVPFHMGAFAYRAMTHIPVQRGPGRRIAASEAGRGHPLISVSPEQLQRAGVLRVPRVEGVEDGRPRLTDGRVLDVANIVWCTGYVPDYSWIQLPGFGPRHRPPIRRGVVRGEPGLYFLGLPFQATVASHLVGGVGKDAAYLARRIAARAQQDHRLADSLPFIPQH